ncbi:MAG: hypothetical protein RJB14_1594 [Pseudomonadota bacterium]
MTSGTQGITRRQILSSVAAIPAALSMNAWSQGAGTYPNKPVSIIVPFTAGGSSDIGARILAVELNKLLNVNFVAENIAGAGGAIGMQKLLRSSPDGYTFAYGGLSESLLIPMINKAVNYKTEDFVPVAIAGAAPVGIVTRPDFPANNIDEMIALVKKNPGKFSIGSAGIGSFGHVMSEVIKSRTGTFMVHIPYRGGAQILTDLISGQIDFAVTTLATAAAMISSKRVKVLGVSSKERVPLVKHVATFGESQTLKNVDMLVWAILFAPPATPDAVVQKMNQTILQVNALPSMRALMLKLGSEVPPALTPAQTKEYLKAQRDLYQEAVSRIQPE